MKYTLKDLEGLFNSHTRESERLLVLCDDNLDKLYEVYYRSKVIYHLFKVPSTKEEVDQLLKIPLNVIHKNGRKGILRPFYFMNNSKFTEYGCIWESGVNMPLVYFWQSRYNFKLITNEYEHK